MRKSFVKALIELAKKDKDVCLLTGDLGYHVFEEFVKEFPDRFFNCGISEQNMVGMSAGLALSGKKPYVYSIVPFATLRPFEQIRTDICYQNLNVKIIGVGGGFSYGTLGSTHIVLEDLAVMRALPNMTVLCPSDLFETEELVLRSYEKSGPTYIRLTNAGQFKTYDQKPMLEIGKSKVLKDGKDGLIIASGLQAGFSLEAANELEKNGHNFKVISLHTIKPIDKKDILSHAKGINKIFVFEEHSIFGGVGSALAEIFLEAGWQGKFKSIGVPDEFSKDIGTADYLRKKYLIDKEGIIKIILKESLR